VVSYSVYLWQQLSLAEPGLYAQAPWLGLPILFLPVAIASYIWVEKPMIRRAHVISGRILERRAQRAAEVPGPA